MNIKIERVKKNLSQRELAEMIGISLPTMRKYEEEPMAADGKTLCKMATIFECSTDYLLERDL